MSQVYVIDGQQLSPNILDSLIHSQILGNLKSIQLELLGCWTQMVSTSRWMETHQSVKINLERK